MSNSNFMLLLQWELNENQHRGQSKNTALISEQRERNVCTDVQMCACSTRAVITCFTGHAH